MQIDGEIISRAMSGDKTAFRWVVQTCQGMLFSLEEEAKDVVQETFIRIWQGMRNYDPQRSFKTWLYTIATRLCLDRLKRNKVLVPMPEDERVLHNFAAESNSPGRQLENSEWVAIVRLLAEGLSEKQRLVFTLCQLEGLSQTIRKRLKDLGYDED